MSKWEGLGQVVFLQIERMMAHLEARLGMVKISLVSAVESEPVFFFSLQKEKSTLFQRN